MLRSNWFLLTVWTQSYSTHGSRQQKLPLIYPALQRTTLHYITIFQSHVLTDISSKNDMTLVTLQSQQNWMLNLILTHAYFYSSYLSYLSCIPQFLCFQRSYNNHFRTIFSDFMSQFIRDTFLLLCSEDSPMEPGQIQSVLNFSHYPLLSHDEIPCTQSYTFPFP